MINAREMFGDIDIYLFDQILKNRFDASMSVLDAGCGGGRNLVYFIRNGFEVFAVDRNSEAVRHVRDLVASIGRQFPVENF